MQVPKYPSLATRSVSYNDVLPSINSPSGAQPRGVQWKPNLSPREIHESGVSPRERHGRSDWRDSHPERERDRSRERWLAQKEYERERDRNRPTNRAKPKRREKDRDIEKKKEKHKSSSMGSTLAKVGTLAMLLEGLDGAF